MGSDNRALITGLFLLALVTATTGIIYWLGTMNSERNTYVVSTRESVSGLNPQSIVFYRGIAVGKVLKVQFDPNDSGTILIPIEVDKNIALTKGVYAVLQLKGVTGLTQIDLQDTGAIDQVLPPGDRPANRIPLMPSLTDKLMMSGEVLLKKTEYLMGRLSLLLNEENTQNISDILGNLKTVSAKLAELQHSLDKALVEVPALSKDARSTLKHIDALTGDLQRLSGNVQALGERVGGLADTGKAAGDVLVQTTLPKVNELLDGIQAAAGQVKRVAAILENKPQAILLGPERQAPGPGEEGFRAPE